MRSLTEVLTLRGRSLLAAGLALVLCGVGLGFVDLLRLGVLLVALPLVTAASTRRHRLRLGVTRSVQPPRVQIDEPAVVTVAVENRGSSPTPLMMVEEGLDHALGDRPRLLLPRLARDGRCELRYRTRAHVRGRHRLGPLGLRLRDPFELSVRIGTVPGHGELLVLPHVVPLGTDRPRATGVGAEGSVPHMVALHGEDDVSIREYRDGDDLRRIHWRSTAKTGSMMVRQEDRPARRRAVVLLDARAGAHRGSGTSSSFEWSVVAVASVVAHLLEHTFAVHLVTPETLEAGTAADGVTLDDALEALAVATTAGPESLPACLHAAGPLAGSGGLVVAVVGGLDDASAQGLAALRQPGSTGLALVVDGATFVEGHGVGGHGGGGQLGDGHGPARVASPVDATIEALTAAGWASTRVGSGTPVAAAWSAVQLTASGSLR